MILFNTTLELIIILNSNFYTDLHILTLYLHGTTHLTAIDCRNIIYIFYTRVLLFNNIRTLLYENYLNTEQDRIKQ